MSFYTVFDANESLLTATATSSTVFPNVTSDLLILHNSAGNRKFAVTTSNLIPGFSVSTSSGSGVTLATSNSTGTSIPPMGLTLLKSTGGTSSTWILTDPPAAGTVKMLMFASSTTSTNYSVTTAAASIQCTGGSSANFINFASTATGTFVNFGQSVTMVALTSTSWIVVGQQRNPTAVSSGQVGAAGSGPIFTSV